MLLIEKLPSKINYYDVGARGQLSAPWSTLLKDKISIYGFEPDVEECARLERGIPNARFFPSGLWSKKETRPFHLNKNPYTSSMYEPNTELIQNFESQHWVNRVPAQTFQTACDSLDHILQNEDPSKSPDFIKIDTQGSEFQILRGAKEVLSSYAPLVLTETWLIEVYKNAETSDEILGLMKSYGYIAIDYNLAAAWKFKSHSGQSSKSKPALVGMDFLFVKNPVELVKMDLGYEKTFKITALLELYGFRHLAFYLVENANLLPSQRGELLALLTKNEQKERSFARRLTKLHIPGLNYLIRQLLGVYEYRPSLHA